MHMAPRAAAWVAWVVWTCNNPLQGYAVERERTSVRSFFWVRPAGRTFLEVKVLYTADMGKC
jgi:hypothetical protein